MSDKQDIVEQLRLWSEQLKSLSRWTSGKLKFPQRITLIGEAADEIEKLRKERDEARRIACTYVSGTYTKDVVSIDRTAAMAEAARRGWDCYKEAK